MSTLLCNKENGQSLLYAGNTLCEICDNIKVNISANDIVIIYINMRVGIGIQIEDQQGIELLVRLRLSGIMNHCILHSPERLFDVVAKNPRNSIVASHGASFQRTAFNSQDYVNDNLAQDYLEAEKNDFISHLKKYYEIGEIRHRLANKYGVYILSQIYNDNIRSKTTETEISCHLPDEDKLMLDVYKYIANQDDKYSTSVIKDINKIRRSFANSRPWVLYIDDMANDGWEDLLVKSIYTDQDRDRFIVNVPKKTDFDDCNYSTYLNKICDIISADRKQRFIECVLLDVRLMDEQGVYEDIEKLSGIRLLKDIREKFPELPVIIVTASNKAETVSHVIKSGATALWTKPGVDYIYTDEYYFNQFYQLLRYVNEAKNKYKNKLEKQIARAGNTLVTLSSSIDKNNIRFNNRFDNYDTIVIDTNIFCFTDTPSKLDKIYSSIYKLYYLSKKCNKSFVIIDDVYLEIKKNARKKNASDDALKKVSEFALRILDNYFVDVSNCYDKLLINSDITWGVRKRKNTNKQDMYVVTSEHIQNRYCHNNINIAEEYRDKANKHGLLHADDSLAYLVTNLCCTENKNVIFISDDRQLKNRIAIEAKVKYGINVDTILAVDVEEYNRNNIRIYCSHAKYIEMIPHWFIGNLFEK